MKRTTTGKAKWTAIIAGFVATAAALPLMLTAQPYISARGGLLNVVEGKADVHNAKERRWEMARQLLQLRSGDELRTRENSRVEMLLNPGSFARLAPETRVQLVNDRLADLNLELLDGSMEVQSGGMKAIRQMQITLKGEKFLIVKDGIYRFDIDDSGTATARVFRGEMRAVAANGKVTKMKKSREATISAGTSTMAFNHFDTKIIDGLSQWASYRDAMMASANSRMRNNFGSTGSGFNPFSWGGGWFYNPFFGCYTFLPGYGFGYNGYYSPYGSYYPIVIVNSGGGTYRTENIARVRESIRSTLNTGKEGWGGGGYASSGGGPVMSAPAAPSSGGGRSEGGGGNREGRH